MGALFLLGITRADNPIIPNQGVCDPRIHIFNDRAYLFSTHDDAPGHPAFTMYDWQVFSSPDLIQWHKEFVLKPEDTFIGHNSHCWATDGAERHGRYYFYFSEGQTCLGVAVSTNGAGGPYHDALGKPLLPKGQTPTAQYDPTVFIDDDPARTPYIVWGYTVRGQQYHIARLNEDMISLAETPRPVILINGWKNDAPFIMKHHCIYYLNSHGGVYATATSVYGPYTFRGFFSHDQTVDHAGFFNWHNQTFLAYGVPDGDKFFRQTKIVYAHFKDNGDIADDPFIEQSSLGVGQYDAHWERIEAEWYFAASDGIQKCENATGFEMRDLTNGSWLAYPNFQNLNRNASLSFRVASANPTGGIIEIRRDGVAGPVLGQCMVPNTGGWAHYQTVTCKLINTVGTNNLYFIFKGSGGELLRLDWFKADDDRLKGQPQKMKQLKTKQTFLGALMALLEPNASTSSSTVSAIPQSCDGSTNSLPCRFTFKLNTHPSGQVVNATVNLPVKISGQGLEPCLKLVLEKSDGTKEAVTDLALNKKANIATFPVTAFLHERERATNFNFYVEPVSGSCASVQTKMDRQVDLKIDSETHPSFPLKAMLASIWKSHHMVNETLLPVSTDGGLPEGRLLFTPKGKVVVRDYALDKTYQEGTDYVVDGNCIRLPTGSSIAFLTGKQLYPDTADAPPKTMPSWKGGYVAFTEGSFWNDRQIAVSYNHQDDWRGPIPSTAPGQLPRTNEKLRTGVPLKVALLGDSISAGASASRDRPPYTPGWGELAMEGLRQKYHCKITFLNASLGGMVSAWGKQVAPFFVTPEKPDLCIIAFGMNDGGNVPVEQYLANTKAIIESVRQENPDAEFILVASWPPNENWRKFAPMDGYLAALKTLESKQIAVADVWSAAAYILKTKRYSDISANHVNHPNDFMVRVYAQVTDALLEAE